MSSKEEKRIHREKLMGRERQRLGGRIDKPRNPKDYQPSLQLRERPTIDSFQKEPALLMP